MPASLNLSEVIQSFAELGGEADWADVKARITEKRDGNFAPYLNQQNFDTTMYQILQQHCEGYKKFTDDVQFVKVQAGRFRLASPKSPPITEFVLPLSDTDTPPGKITTHILRIIRDTVAAKSLKAIYEYKCQICGLRIEPIPGKCYAEVHHVRPLGGGHNGYDTNTNMLVLCPNHHAMFDFGIPRFIANGCIAIGETNHTLTWKHTLAEGVIAYHNENIHKQTIS